MTGFDQSQSSRLGQRTPIETTTVTMFNGVDIPESSWDGRLIYRPDRQVMQVYRTSTGAYEDVTGGIEGMLTYVGADVPVAHAVGDLWFNSGAGNAMYMAMTPGASAIAIGQWELQQDSATAQATADAKARVFYQDTAPDPADTEIDLNDLWVNTGNDNQVQLWNGTAWTDTKYGTGALDTDAITMNALTILDKLDLRGDQNFLNGDLALAAGITDPGQMPTLSIGYASTVYHPSITGIKQGLTTDPTNTYWVSVDARPPGGGIVSKIEKREMAGTATATIINLDSSVYAGGGVVRIGAFYYVLWAVQFPTGPPDYGAWRVSTYRASDGAWQHDSGQMSLNGDPLTTPGTLPALGTDGTNLYVVWPDANHGSPLMVAVVNLPNGNLTSALQLSAGFGAQHLSSVTKTSTGFSGQRYVVSTFSGTLVYTTAGIRQTADEWPKARTTALRGLSDFNGSWHSFDGAVVSNYTFNSGTWDYAYSWKDSTGGVGNTAETKVGPIRTQALARWAQWTISMPSKPPGAGGPNDPDTGVLYASPTSTPLVLQQQLVAPALSATFSSLLTTGTAPKSVSEFDARANQVLGRIYTPGSSLGADPTIELNGDGSGGVGPYRWTNAGGYADDTGWVPITIASGFKQSTTTAYVPAARLKGGVVRLRGQISPNSGGFTVSSSINIGTVPAGLRPDVDKFYSAPGGSAISTHRLQITAATGVMLLVTGPNSTSVAVLDPAQYWVS